MIVWSPEAAADVESACDLLARRNPKDAQAQARELFDVLERLVTDPTAGSRYVLKSGEVVSGWLVHPFRIYYQGSEDALYVVRVYCDAP